VLRTGDLIGLADASFIPITLSGTCVCVCVYGWVYGCICGCDCQYIYTYMYTCIYIYICIYMYTADAIFNSYYFVGYVCVCLQVGVQV